MGKLTLSGNMIVDAMGEMKITGDPENVAKAVKASGLNRFEFFSWIAPASRSIFKAETLRVSLA